MTPKEHEVSLLDLAKKLGAKVKDDSGQTKHRFAPGDIVYCAKEDAEASDFNRGEELQVLETQGSYSYMVLSTATGSQRLLLDSSLAATREEAMR